MPNTLTVTDNRTGKQFELPIDDNSIKAEDLGQIRVDDDSPGLVSFDPALANTAACRSAVSYIDGEKGILRYRGYPIEQLAEKSSYLETAYLIVKGELPPPKHFQMWQHNIKMHTIVHENVKGFIEGFRYDAHQMGILIGTIGALSTFYPEAKEVRDPDVRWQQIVRLVAKMPTMAAYAYRRLKGFPYVYPENELSYTSNFLNMLFRIEAKDYEEPNPVLERALDVLFILHADHEQNCSTTTMRAIGSSGTDPYSSLAGAMAALYGPMHGGANEAVLRMLERIGTLDNVPGFIERVKAKKERLMGFGHRVYKAYDPRASIIKRTADEVFEVTERNPLLDIALELERIALNEDYFIERNLYPNVDFYSGMIYQAMGFPVEMFPVLFAIPRTVGWLAQWDELLRDPEQRIARPRQIYVGSDVRDYIPIGERG